MLCCNAGKYCDGEESSPQPNKSTRRAELSPAWDEARKCEQVRSCLTTILKFSEEPLLTRCLLALLELGNLFLISAKQRAESRHPKGCAE